MIEVKNLKKTYKGGTNALKGVSFKMDKKITAILGRNGAGKTTLLRILSTQLLPTSGTAKINGLDVITQEKEIRKMIISIPQEATPVGSLTVIEHLEMYLAAMNVYGEEAMKLSERSLKLLDMYHARNELGDDLSGGMKRKIFVAMAIASHADIVFLDEPTLGLDPVSRLEVWSAIRALKGTVIITTHYLEEAKELADEIIMMEQGRVVLQGTNDQLMKPLNGFARVEGLSGKEAQYRIGNTTISYIKDEYAKRYLKRGYKVKPVSLEDLFIKRGIKIRGKETEGEW